MFFCLSIHLMPGTQLFNNIASFDLTEGAWQIESGLVSCNSTKNGNSSGSEVEVVLMLLWGSRKLQGIASVDAARSLELRDPQEKGWISFHPLKFIRVLPYLYNAGLWKPSEGL